jgi:hypothetical protein
MDRALKIACVMLAGMALAAGAMAQSVATANLHGTVLDPKGAVVSNATVMVRNEAQAFERTTKTGAEGTYQFVLLPPGHYTVIVEAPGFTKLVAKDVGVTVGQEAEFSVTMKVAAAATEVTVTGEAALVETQRTSSTTTIEQERIENLPINGRNYINFTLTDSQVARDVAPSIGAAPTSGLNFSGQRARANLVNVDGADNVDASVNGIRSTVSQEAVQEFQIINNSYAAEYGRASGGVVNIITRSGANAFHGTGFGFLRHRSIQADNPFTNTPDPAYTRVQAGFTLSGPIKKDKTFFFFAYETTRRHETGFSDVGRDCLGTTSCFGLVTTDVSSKFLAPPGSFVIQATQAQAAAIAALPPGLASQAYSFFVGSASAIGLNGTLVGTGAVGLTAFSPGGPEQFASSCNILTNFLCNGLPTDFMPLTTQIGNYPVFEGTSLWSARLDHRFNNNNSALLRVNVSPSLQDGIQVNAQNQPFGQNAYSRTSWQQYRDLTITAQDTWLIGNNKVNEFRFQYARRGLRYNFNTNTPDGSKSAVNIVGFAFIGREPFSYVDRVEQRYQFVDNFSWIKGNHSFKFGVDIQHIPVDAAFTVNFGNVYNFGALSATNVSPLFAGLPGLSPVQAYGLGIPSTMVQGIGNPSLAFSVKPMGFYFQDSWRIRPNITLNYGVRYDVELASTFGFPNTLSADAYDALGLQKSFGTDTNNIQPRIGIAWDPWNDGKTVFRANYGMFYDNPLLGLTFLGAATDGVGTPQLILFGSSPCTGLAASPLNLNATNVFQGILGITDSTGGAALCLPPGAATAMGYQPSQQRFDPFFPNSTFIDQNFLNPATFQPLINQPFGFPTGKGFEHAYAQQASVSMEHDFGGNFAMSITYNYTHGTHLNRPINANPVRGDLLVQNWWNAVNAGLIAPTVSPLAVQSCGVFPTLGGPVTVVPASLVNFFRPSGINPSMAQVFGPVCTGFAESYINTLGLGVNSPTCTITAVFTITSECTPFSDMVANYSNGSSVYHGLTAQMRKRFSRKYEFLASYTWSHTIDDSTDLQSLLSPQDSYFPYKERASSTFDQRHRFVFSAVYQSGKLSGDGFWSKFFSDWTVAPIIELSSGRPFTILTAEPVNFQFAPNSARPNIVPAGTATNSCGFPAQASPYSPTGFFQTPCFVDAALSGNITLEALDGNLGRNSAQRPYTVFTDFRFAKRINITERVKLDAITDMFNLINRFNVADVSLLCSSTNCNAGQPTAAYDPRQFQFALKLSF